jgi:hypothetical protein
MAAVFGGRMCMGPNYKLKSHPSKPVARRLACSDALAPCRWKAGRVSGKMKLLAAIACWERMQTIRGPEGALFVRSRCFCLLFVQRAALKVAA